MTEISVDFKTFSVKIAVNLPTFRSVFLAGLFLLMVSSATAVARLAEPVLALAVVAVAVLALGAPVAVLLTYDVNCKLINKW